MAVILATFVALAVCWCPSQSLTTVYIDGAEGNDSLECLTFSSTETPCQSLSFVSENLTQRLFVHIEILGDVLNLTRAVDFTDYSNLTICGSGTNNTLYCNESEAGLEFVRVTNLTMYSLTVKNCGTPRPSTSTQNHTLLLLPVAVYVLNCTHVSLQAVDFVSSNGTGLSIYDTNGTVDIVHCNFINNSVSNKNSSGGGGVHIEFTICSPGIVENCDSNRSSRNNNSRYYILNCTFTNNSAHSPKQAHMFVPPSQQSSVPRLGKGGGLYISIGSDASSNVFLVDSCIFRNNRASYRSAGMIAEFLNSVRHNHVSVVKTHFEGNRCVQTQFSGGGGLDIAFMFYSKFSPEKQQPQNNSFECLYSTFKNNVGHIGGGTEICTTKEMNHLFLSTILFHECEWIENEAAMGAAVFITPGIWDYTNHGFLPFVTFRDCKFESNFAQQTLTPPMAKGTGVKIQSVGYGALHIIELKVVFKGISQFSNNSGSVIHLSNSVIEFKEGSEVILSNNTSHSGGAVAMYGSSLIQIQNSSTFILTNNRAVSKGGAIYFDSITASRPAYHNCFISSHNFSPVNSTFIFNNNSANYSGSSIFATTFESCALLCSGTNIPTHPQDIMQCIANFYFDHSNDSLSTRPNRFDLEEKSPIQIIPGVETTLLLSATDEANISLSGVVYEASLTDDANNVTLDPAFLQLSSNKIKVEGRNGSTAQLQLFTFDMIVSLNITITECQPGYHYNPSSLMCVCAASEYIGLEGCDPNAYLKQGYWMGYCSGNSNELCTATCPYGYCSYSGTNPEEQYHLLPNASHSLNTDICGPSRTNRLCGECSLGYSLHHNSWKRTCGTEKLCHLGWLFYVLSDILPLTLLFIVVLVLNISFTTGNANCFVLYGQLLSSLAFKESIHFPYAVKVIKDIVIYPYNILNLNFLNVESLSYCLWKNATFLQAVMIDYLTVGFALVLVLGTIFVAKYQYIVTKIFSKFQKRSSFLIHGISAFFVLCYSQATTATFHILHYSCLYSAHVECKVKVVNRAGHLNYLEGEHVPYAIVAIFVLLFMVVIPPLLLLTYPLVFNLFGLCNLSETKLVTMIWRMMPIHFLDAFQSSFKDKYRFFAGLYFLYRVAILAPFVCAQSRLAFYSIAQVLLTLILTAHSILQPHKERKQNIVDSLLFANLCLINAITLYYYGTTEVFGPLTSEYLISTLAVVQSLLVILPLVVAVIVCAMEWRLSTKKRDFEELPSLRSDEKNPLIRK